MSFRVNWPQFSDEFLAEARARLTAALNKNQLSSKIAGDIAVTELDMGSQPPDLEILEIGELGDGLFRGIFKLTYVGDAFLVLQTKVQANPLGHCRRMPGLLGRHNPATFASKPLQVPMKLRISHLKLRGIIVLVVEKDKGVTLVFKNDPLETVTINSTFDDIPPIRRFLQETIEEQLRCLFHTDIPQMIHALSKIHQQQRQSASA
ncbi:hypothetical protein CXG81DRAFT_6908, partial [Caulochytrium protostelioides]